MWVAGSLAAIAGYVDVICFIRYQTFVATMTGNLVMTGQTCFEVIHTSMKKYPTKPVSSAVVRAHLSFEEALMVVAFRAAVMAFNCLGAFCYEAWHRRHPDRTAKSAAPWLALCALVPDLCRAHGLRGGDLKHEGANGLQMWSVLPLAFALGFTHFLCSPAATGSRLKNVVMASTGHMHKVSKLLHRMFIGDTLKQSDWDGMAISSTITLSMLIGAVLGGAMMHLNPFGEDTDDFLLVPVMVVLFVGLWAHDEFIDPPA